MCFVLVGNFGKNVTRFYFLIETNIAKTFILKSIQRWWNVYHDNKRLFENENVLLVFKSH